MKLLRLLSGLLLIYLLSVTSCNKPPYKADYENIGGYVIGKETCNTDESQDYWLLDFTVYPNSLSLEIH